MAKDNVWAVGDVMHCGSDDDRVMHERQNPERDSTKAFRRVHEGAFGRNSQFGWGRKHDAKVVKSDATRVDVVCACGAIWNFPQSSDEDRLIKENDLPRFDLLKIKKETPDFLPSEPKIFRKLNPETKITGVSFDK